MCLCLQAVTFFWPCICLQAVTFFGRALTGAQTYAEELKAEMATDLDNSRALTFTKLSVSVPERVWLLRVENFGRQAVVSLADG